MSVETARPSKPLGTSMDKDAPKLFEQQWDIGLFDCCICKVKDCGIHCCLYNMMSSPCIWCRALEAAGIGTWSQHCLGLSICCQCYSCRMRQKVARKYNMEEGCFISCLIDLCCPTCSYYQQMNEILVKEQLTWECCDVVKSDGEGGVFKFESGNEVRILKPGKAKGKTATVVDAGFRSLVKVSDKDGKMHNYRPQELELVKKDGAGAPALVMYR